MHKGKSRERERERECKQESYQHGSCAVLLVLQRIKPGLFHRGGRIARGSLPVSFKLSLISMRSLSGLWFLVSMRGERASVVFRILIRMRQSGSGFRSLISMRGESGCGLTNAQGQVLFGGSLRVCSAGPTAHTSHNTKSPLCAPTPWLVMLHTCYLTHHNGALLWKASPLVRTETVHFCGSCRGSSGVSATSFTTEQVFKADAANVITPFLTASALQTMLCNTSRASMGLLRHKAVHPFFLYFKLQPKLFL